MKTIFAETCTKLVMCVVVAMGLSASAFASCGDSLAAMAAGKALVSSSVSQQLAAASPAEGTINSSIVGLWYVQFSIGGQPIQEAFQTWNLGGDGSTQSECRPAHQQYLSRHLDKDRERRYQAGPPRLEL